MNSISDSSTNVSLCFAFSSAYDVATEAPQKTIKHLLPVLTVDDFLSEKAASKRHTTKTGLCPGEKTGAYN